MEGTRVAETQGHCSRGNIRVGRMSNGEGFDYDVKCGRGQEDMRIEGVARSGRCTDCIVFQVHDVHVIEKGVQLRSYGACAESS